MCYCRTTRNIPALLHSVSDSPSGVARGFSSSMTKSMSYETGASIAFEMGFKINQDRRIIGRLGSRTRILSRRRLAVSSGSVLIPTTILRK